MIHCGSRGLGYQVCDDFLDLMALAAKKYRIALPDPQLVSVPVRSPEGQRYLGAMRAAANFAWANRQVIMALVERALGRVFGGNRRSLGFRLVYDVAHNIAKVEEHLVEGEKRQVIVHRKGATRAFPAHHPETPPAYKAIGQPVLVPGDMGRASYVLVGTPKAMEACFGSSAHGAGRMLSRTAARRSAGHRNLVKEMGEQGVVVAARSPKTLAEEMPEAYKDVSLVVEALERAGIVARFWGRRCRYLGVPELRVCYKGRPWGERANCGRWRGCSFSPSCLGRWWLRGSGRCSRLFPAASARPRRTLPAGRGWGPSAWGCG